MTVQSKFENEIVHSYLYNYHSLQYRFIRKLATDKNNPLNILGAAVVENAHNFNEANKAIKANIFSRTFNLRLRYGETRKLAIKLVRYAT